jgi:hypothetical protein
MKYIPTLFNKNVRVDLSDKNICVPKRKKFKEVSTDYPPQRTPMQMEIFNRLNPTIRNSDTLMAIMSISLLASLILITISCVQTFKDNPNHIFYLLTSISCAISFVCCVIKNGFKSANALIWSFNSIVWFLNFIK